MPLAPQAPYDSLATVTQLVRVALGDFIQNIQPYNTGTVFTNGNLVTYNTGNQFTALFNGATMIINGMPFVVAQVLGPTSLQLATSAGVLNNKPYTLTIPTGDIFADTQAYVLPTINLAWRKLQTKLANQGHPRLESEADILALPVVANLDPVSQQWINWANFFDGANLLSPATTPAGPVLPPDFISPLRLWERPSVSGATPAHPNLNRLRPMSIAPDGLRSIQKGSWNRFWDWRNDAIYLPGSILSMDLRLKYAAYLPDIAVAGGGFGATAVPVMGCAEALAYYAAGIFVTPRGSMLGPGFESQGNDAVAQITNSFAKLQQRASYSRIPWGSRGRRSRLLR